MLSRAPFECRSKASRRICDPLTILPLDMHPERDQSGSSLVEPRRILGATLLSPLLGNGSQPNCVIQAVFVAPLSRKHRKTTHSTDPFAEVAPRKLSPTLRPISLQYPQWPVREGSSLRLRRLWTLLSSQGTSGSTKFIVAGFRKVQKDANNLWHLGISKDLRTRGYLTLTGPTYR